VDLVEAVGLQELQADCACAHGQKKERGAGR
jgi:hypothetical protein